MDGGMKNKSSTSKIFDVQEARRTGWRAAQVTVVTNGLMGFRDAARNSSSDPSTGPDNGIPVVPRVDGWDGEGP